MRYSSRFFLYAPFAGLLLLAAIASVNWWVKAAAMSRQLDAVNGHEIMPGVRLSFSGKALGGFPFRVDTILKNLRVAVAEVTGPVVWTTDDFAMHALAYGPVHAILEAAGHQTLSWRDRHGAAHTFSFLPGTFRASAILQRGKLVRFDGEIVDLDGAEFRAGNAQLHARTMRDGLDVYFKLQNAHVTGGYARALGPDIMSLVASDHLNHGNMLQGLLRGNEAPQTALDKWRDAGGSVNVSEFTLARKIETLSFAGNLTLDSAHDLSGTLRAHNGSTYNFTGDHIGRQDVLP
jgi:hypothetical protein